MKDVIGFDYNDTNEANFYAEQLLIFGDSVETIVSCITTKDIEGFEWMKFLHRHSLSEKVVILKRHQSIMLSVDICHPWRQSITKN